MEVTSDAITETVDSVDYADSTDSVDYVVCQNCEEVDRSAPTHCPECGAIVNERQGGER